MLSLATINYKRTITLDGEQIIDLTESIFNTTVSIKIVRTVTVTEEFEGRPSYFTKMVLGDENVTDIFLSINGISNPLTIKAGMVILVPDLTSLKAAIKDLNADSNVQNNKAMQSLNAKYNPKFNNTDPTRVTMLSNGSAVLRTPNMTPPNTVPVTVTPATIILGTNTSTSRCKSNLTDAQTRTEIIRNAVRTNLMSTAITSVAATKGSNVTLTLQAGGNVISSQSAVKAAVAATKSMQQLQSPIG